MWIIIAAIIIFIIFADSDTKPSANKKGNTNTDSRLHCTVNRTGSYSSILNQMEQIVFLIAKRCPWMKLQVLVMVRKINASTCSVSFQIEDVYLKKNNIPKLNTMDIDKRAILTFLLFLLFSIPLLIK